MKRNTSSNGSISTFSSDVMDRVLYYAKDCEANGRFPYDGQWLTKEEIEAQIRYDRKRALVHTVELTLLFVSVYGAAALSWIVIDFFNY